MSRIFKKIILPFFGKDNSFRSVESRICIPVTSLIAYWPFYTGPDKFETGPLRDLIGSVPKRSHESGPKLDPHLTGSEVQCERKAYQDPTWDQF